MFEFENRVDPAETTDCVCLLLFKLSVQCSLDKTVLRYCRCKFCHPFLAWAWFAKAKCHSCHTKKSTLAKTFTEKTSKSTKHACHYASKERPVKITMYLGLDIIIKIKFTTIFDRCAILNVLNYLTKNFES